MHNSGANITRSFAAAAAAAFCCRDVVVVVVPFAFD